MRPGFKNLPERSMCYEILGKIVAHLTKLASSGEPPPASRDHFNHWSFYFKPCRHRHMNRCWGFQNVRMEAWLIPDKVRCDWVTKHSACEQVRDSQYPYVISSSPNFPGMTANQLRVTLNPDDDVQVYDMTVQLCCRQPLDASSSFIILLIYLFTYLLIMNSCFVDSQLTQVRHIYRSSFTSISLTLVANLLT